MLYDAFGQELKAGDEVMFAGTDCNRRPTINRGCIDLLNEAQDKVRVVREMQSGVHIADATSIRVWVHVLKVGRI